MLLKKNNQVGSYFKFSPNIYIITFYLQYNFNNI